MALGIQPIQELTLEADNEYEEDDPLTEYPPSAQLLADDVPMAQSVDLDKPAVAGDTEYMELVAAQQNIPPALIVHLKQKYGF